MLRMLRMQRVLRVLQMRMRGGELLLLLLLNFMQMRGGDSGGCDAEDGYGLFRVARLRGIRRGRIGVGPPTDAADVTAPRIRVAQQHLFAGNRESADDGVLNPGFRDFVLTLARTVRRSTQVLQTQLISAICVFRR